MIKYPKTPRLKDIDLKSIGKLQAVVSEKLDGANVGISFDNNQLQLQSRGHILIGGPKEIQFNYFKNMCYSMHEQLYETLGFKYLLFGEYLYAKHRVFYDSLPSYFMTYDVYDKEMDLFLTTKARQQMLSDLQIPEAPILYQGQLRKVSSFYQFIGESTFRSSGWKKALNDEAAKINIKDPMSHTDDSRLMEGVYIKIEDDKRVVQRFKIPRTDFEKVRDSDLWKKGVILPNRLSS